MPNIPVLNPTIADKIVYTKERIMPYCPICGKQDFEPLDNLKESLPEYHLVICQNDGFITYAPQIPNIKSFYRDNPIPQSTGFIKTKGNKVVKHNKLIINYLKKHNVKLESVLDYGASDGYLLKLLKEHYPEIQEYGIEINKGHANWAKYIDGLNVTTDDNLSLIPDASKDLICCYHVLEHIQSPERLLIEFKRILKDDGLLYIAVPTINKIRHSVFDKESSSCLQDDHINVFTNKTLIYFLNNWGFKVDFYDDELYGTTLICKKQIDQELDKRIKISGLTKEEHAVLLYKDSYELLVRIKQTFALKEESSKKRTQPDYMKELYKKALDIYDYDFSLILNYAQLFEEIDYEDIVQIYIDKYPDLFELKTNLGFNYYKNKQYDKAIEVLNKLVEQGIYDAYTLETLGYAYYYNKDIIKCIDIFKRIIKEFPYETRIIEILGAILEKL